MQIIKPSPFIKVVAHTTITSLITVVSLILVTRLLAHGIGPEGFGAYLLARRIVTTIAPFSTLFLGVALARYISISKKDKYYYLLCGLVLSVVPCLSVLIIGLLFTNELTNLVFHNQTYSSLFRATLFMILGYSCYCFIHRNLSLYYFHRALVVLLHILYIHSSHLEESFTEIYV